MRKKMKQTLGLTMVAAMSISCMAGCGKKDEEKKADPTKEVTEATKEATEEPTEEATEEPTAEPEEVRDLGGLVVTIANWVDVVEPEEKASGEEEALWEYRHEMMEKYNFTVEEKAMCQWNTTLEQFTVSTMAGTPEAEVYRFHPNFVVGAINSGLCYDISKLSTVNLEDQKWNPNSTEIMSKGDAVYGLSPQREPRLGVFFNKRLFEEAGINPEEIYDLQKSGEWTWAKFEEYAEKLTRDIDNDGVADVYGCNVFPGEFYQIAAWSNGGTYVGKDADGKYFDNSSSPETMEAMQWATDFLAKGYDLFPEQWDGQDELFTSARVAMYVGDRWKCGIWKDMEDDFGFVCFPKGPKATSYAVGSNDEIWVIPNSYSEKEAEDILFALNIWANPAPGYDGEDDWMSSYYPAFRDERAVEETLAIMREPEVSKLDYITIIPEVSIYQLADDIYWNGTTVTEALQAKKGAWQAALDAANGIKK